MAEFRFAEAVLALNCKAKFLRSCIDRGVIKLLSDKPHQKWRVFTYADLAVLAVTLELFEIGIEISDANELARQAVPNFSQKAPPAAFVAYWRPRRLILWKNDQGEWEYNLFGIVEDGLVPIPEQPTVVIMDVATIIEDVFRRIEDNAT